MNDCIELRQDPNAAIPEIYQGLVNHDDYERITNVVKEFNQAFRDKLRSKTALRTVVGNAGVSITFSNTIPDPLVEAINYFSEPVLRLKRLMPALTDLHNKSIYCHEAIFGNEAIFVNIVEARRLLELGDVDEEVFSNFISLIEKILRRIQQLDIEKPLQQIREDIFGAYKPASGVVEIYWLPIAIFCKPLGLSMESLTKVVLIHELAHAFTHRGRDVNGNSWNTQAFCDSDPFLIEGLAQYYTAIVAQEISKDRNDLDSEFVTYELLMKFQNDIYKGHLNWLDLDQKLVGEAIRFSLLEIRQRSKGAGYNEFTELLKINLSRLSSPELGL